jgi:anti-sigma factor RsiW
MECQDIRKNLSAYLEGMASPEDQELIDQHIASCRACSTALYELNRTGEVLKNLKEVEPPPWMAKKIMARVREEAESKRGFIQKLFYPLHIKIPLEAFATVLIAVIAVYVFKAMEPEMKDLQVPSPKEPVIARQEAPYPAKAPAVETQGVREKAVTQESLAKTNGKDLPVAPAPPSTAPKKEAALPLPAEPPRIGESRTAERVPSPPAAAGVAPAQEEKIPLAEGAARERKELKKAQPMTPSVRMAAKSKAEVMSFLVRARDVRLAGGEVESLLHQLGASRIERVSRASDEIITAEVKAEKIKELFEKLMLVGGVEEKDGRLDSIEKDATLRIEIVPGR